MNDTFTTKDSSAERMDPSFLSSELYRLHELLPGSWNCGRQYSFTEKFAKQSRSPTFFMEIYPKVESICRELALCRQFGIGDYHTGTSRVFKYDLANEFDGLFFGVYGKEGNQVGVLDFRIGFPVEIISIQGTRNGGPREFYQQTGYHFDHVLMNLVCGMVARHFKFEERSIFYEQPRLVFNISHRADGIRDPHLSRRLSAFLNVKTSRRQGLYPDKFGALPFVKNHFVCGKNRLMAKLAIVH